MRIHVYGAEAEASLARGSLRAPSAGGVVPTFKGGSAAFLDIHYHGKSAADLVGNPVLAKGGSAAFLDIHYHGLDASDVLVASRSAGEMAETDGGLMSSSSVVANALAGRVSAARQPALVKPGGSAAFLDIHYHGKSPADLAENPALSKAGSAAFLDIHYHGLDASEALVASRSAGEAAEAEGGLMSSSSAAANALGGRAVAASQLPLAKPAGSAAFLDIHYHGKSPADLAGNPALSKAGSAAFLDIHYHGDAAMGGVMSEAGSTLARPGRSTVPQLPTGGSAAFLDIHYHGKSISAAEVNGLPGLHIGDVALLDIHYHG